MKFLIVESSPLPILIPLGPNNNNKRELKQVDSFKYLGSVLTRDVYSTREIKMRTAIAKEKYHS